MNMSVSSELDPVEFLAGHEGLLRRAVGAVLGYASMYFDDAMQEARLKVLKEVWGKAGRKFRNFAGFIQSIARRAAMEVMRKMATVVVANNKYWAGKVRTYFFETSTVAFERCGSSHTTPFDMVAHQEDVRSAHLLVERARQILHGERCRYSLWQVLCQRLGVCPDKQSFLGRRVVRKSLAKKYRVTPQAISKAYKRAVSTLESSGIRITAFARALLTLATTSESR